MPIRRHVHAYYSTLNPPLLYVRTLTHKDTYTRIYIHSHVYGYGKARYYVLSGRTGIHTLGHTIRVCEGGEAGGRRQSCRHAATCIHT